jgi:hypothetical protein
LLTRSDIPHVFLSDIDNITNMIAKEFPDVAKLKSIGTTWKDRKMKVLELDARKFMKSKGIKVIEGASEEDKKNHRVALVAA